MAFVGTILQEVVKFKKNQLEKKEVHRVESQDHVLMRLLDKAKDTEFGRAFGFADILASSDVKAAFAESVRVFSYNRMYDEWWHRTLNDEPDITWPGRIKYFALTSGTSGSPSKRVPVSIEMAKDMKHTSIRQMLNVYDLGMPKEFYQKSVLMLGGSTKLRKVGIHQEGDLSGILVARVPGWFYRFRKPNKKLGGIKDWETKLDMMVDKAPKWDIGIACGVPAWIQIFMERIIERHGVETIHDIWPNLRIYVHGGVSVAPYKDSLKKLMGRDMYYLDTYLASEGFMAFETPTSNGHMQLVLDKGIYFEFVPFNEKNFTPDGELLPGAEVLNITQVENDVDYALVISTCAGVWRYLIGDTIRFKNKDNFEIIITGRTKHFLSLCGEHLSVDNMNQGLEMTGEQLGASFNEFTVAGVPYRGMFAHHWWIGSDKEVDPAEVRRLLDENLRKLNDDYGTERGHALKEVVVEILPTEKFYNYMRRMGKFGGQSKFPRVMNKYQLESWKEFLSSN